MRPLLALLGLLLAALLVPAFMVGGQWVSFLRLEKSIVEKMDSYYLTITVPGREEYLLEDDEVFEVPYMASRLSVEAEPTRIYDCQDRLIGEFESEKGVYVRDPGKLPVFLKKALVASEDGTFYEHEGINYKAIVRAFLTNMARGRHTQGGSTLTQQLAKVMFTTRKKTYGRKIFEAFCARKLESKFTKDQILLMYLNFVYFGHGSFGVESASRYYFGKSAEALDLAEAALLIGILPAPNKYSPFVSPELAKARQRTVLARMARLGYVPESAIERHVEGFWKSMDKRRRAPEASFWRMKENASPYLVETVRRALAKQFSKERILKGGLSIHTTFDLEYQKAAEKALREGLRKVAEEGKAEVPVEGGLAALRPSDGAILALVGGSGFNFGNQLNRAKDIGRPMGSSVKPFIFAQAFESGRFSPDDRIEDAPVRYKIGGGAKWSPQNYGNKYFGDVTLSTGLVKSLNSVAIRVLDALEIDEVRVLLSKATGAPKDRFPRNLSLALGTADLSPLESAAAYAVFANGGRTLRPGFLHSIEDRAGTVIAGVGVSPRAEETPELSPYLVDPEAGELVLSTGTCKTMLSILSHVPKKGGTAYGAALRTGFTIPAAGKTGTTNDNRDAWFAGVTGDIAAAVWVGNDDMRVTLGKNQTGGHTAAPVWMEFVKAAYKDRPAPPLLPEEEPQFVESQP